MKNLAILLLATITIELRAQTDVKFVFFDPCTNETLELDYGLWVNDSTINIQAGQPVTLDEEYYLLSTQVRRK